jgi:3-deoxy-D-manno-octulosonic-acid transferase
VVLVPRHPQRFDAVAALAAQRGIAFERRSAAAATGGPDVPGRGTRLLLGDTMGEMSFWYGAADAAVIGGSFLPLGGQNLIEACAAGVPVLFGPSMFNFAQAARIALDEGAALQADDAASAMRAALDLLGDGACRARMGEAGRRMCEAHRGAAARHLEVIGALLTARARD